MKKEHSLKKIKVNKTLLFSVAAICLTLFIFSNSMQTAPKSSASSGRIVNIVMTFAAHMNLAPDIGQVTHIIRKLAHMFEFFMHGLFIGLAFLSYEKHFKSKIVYILFFGLLTACTDEFIQLYSVGRASMVSDIWIDFSGTVISAILCIALCILKRQHIQKERFVGEKNDA